MNRRAFLTRAGMIALVAPQLPRMAWDWYDPYIIDPTGRRDSTRGLQRLFDRMPNAGTFQGKPGGRYRVDGVININQSNISINNMWMTRGATG